MKKLLYMLILAAIIMPNSIVAQETEPADAKAGRMEWFADAKLGIFIHWGIYAVNGIDESWSFFNGYIPYDEYMKQRDGFTAKKYDPGYWASLIRESGAKYAVLTSKHHDGVALWPSKCGDLHMKKDYISPFMKALRDEGLKAGLYYSLLDWSHPDYPNFTAEEKRYEDDPGRWERFVKFNFCQLDEIISRFNPDLYWFDGDWEQSAEQWHAPEIRENILKANPSAIINSRLQGYGDYATPEQGLPVHKPEGQYWELCMTMNDSWGFQHNDKNYKSPNQIIRIFVDCISMGGNLLLDMGPKADGTIAEEQVTILKELGRWTSKHGEAIYGTKAGIPHEYFYGPTALSADRRTLYLYLDGKPNGPVMIKGLKNKVNRIWVVGNGTKLSYDIKMKQYWSAIPGILYIDVPEEVLDPQVTIIAVLLDGEIDLHK
ncbi:MAG TPA: alpha-L-fucosidase [Bacteroidales bacterium]|nr:alpha-L-fucosidase [Bacteroidales bacterium]